MVAVTLCLGGVLAQQWAALSPTQPSRASSVAMVTDSWRGRVVLFGGWLDFIGHREGTWEWDGRGWQQRRTAAVPVHRLDHAMAFDPVRREVVMFGGYDLHVAGAGFLSDTWVFDGFEWRLASSTGPPPRSQHAMAFDPVNLCVVVAGGQRDAVILADQWSWDGTAWWLAAVAPPLRTQAAMCTDTARNRVVLFGGRDGPLPNDASNATWEWDGSQWRDVSPASGPGRRYSMRLTYDPARGRSVMTGGRNTATTVLAETWEWDGATWRMRAAMPWARTEHGAAYDAQTGRVLVHAGRAAYPDAELGDLQAFDGSAWRQVHGSENVTWDGWDYRYAGVDFRGEPLSFSSRNYNLRTSVRLRWTGHEWVDDAPPASQALPHDLQSWSLAADPVRDRLVLFGGRDEGVLPPQPRDELWTSDGAAWQRRPRAGAWPTARWGAALAWDPTRQVLLLFGGFGGGYLDDTWQWDGAAWSQRLPPNQPPPTERGVLVFDPVTQAMLLCGGQTGSSSYMDDTWSHGALGDWQMVHQEGAVQHIWRLAGVDPNANRVVRVGPAGSQLWDGSAWVSLGGDTELSASDRTWGGLCTDVGHGQLLLPHTPRALGAATAAVLELQPGCPLTGPAPQLASGLAVVGQPGVPFDLRATANALALFGMALSPATTSLAPGCSVLQSPLFQRLQLCDAGGFTSVALDVPDAPALAGVRLWAQAGALDGAGISVSALLEVAVGW